MTNEEDLKDHLAERKQEATNHGLIEVEQYAGVTMPRKNFDIIAVTQDTLCCRFDDCSADGDEIYRDGIWMNIDITKSMWRSAVILLAGPKASPELKAGVRIAFPSDKGIKSVQINENGEKENIIFINEDRIFGILAPKTEE